MISTYFLLIIINTRGISFYITGVTILDKIVELIRPPINTMANGAIRGLEFKAIGIKPQMTVTADLKSV